MNFKFNKKDILTIPNLLSGLRIVLIPIIAILCVNYEFTAAVVLLIISGLTDVADGFIARKFDMISDLGKMLDPVADKLTQAVVALCLLSLYPDMQYLFILMVIKEILMAANGYICISKIGKVPSAAWHGKMATVVVTVVLGIHMIWRDLNVFESGFFLIFAGEVMIFSLVAYILKTVYLIRKARK